MCCCEGWPDKCSLNDAIKPYWSVQNILLNSSRIVIPSSTRPVILDKIHREHQGVSKCRELARKFVWWPGLSLEIQDLLQQCRVCALQRDNKPEGLIMTPLLDRPWQIVATELSKLKGFDYLLAIGYFSRYVEVAAMQKTTKSSEVIRALKSIFARNGIPGQARSDNCPQFDSTDFCYFANE